MRINVYSQELTPEVQSISQRSNTGALYHAARLVLRSAPQLHHTSDDDDRSAITIWLPASEARREEMAQAFEKIAKFFREAPPSETRASPNISVSLPVYKKAKKAKKMQKKTKKKKKTEKAEKQDYNFADASTLARYKQMRENAGLSQYDVAGVLGCSRSRVSHFEQGIIPRTNAWWKTFAHYYRAMSAKKSKATKGGRG